jgi:hypothetical protein
MAERLLAGFFLWHVAEERAGLADAADGLAIEALGNGRGVLLDRGALGFEADFNQSVLEERGFDFADDGVRQALLAHVYMRLEALCEPAEVFFFSAGEWF